MSGGTLTHRRHFYFLASRECYGSRLGDHCNQLLWPFPFPGTRFPLNFSWWPERQFIQIWAINSISSGRIRVSRIYQRHGRTAQTVSCRPIAGYHQLSSVESPPIDLVLILNPIRHVYNFAQPLRRSIPIFRTINPAMYTIQYIDVATSIKLRPKPVLNLLLNPDGDPFPSFSFMHRPAFLILAF